MAYLGELCALLAALTWSFSVILFKRSEQVTPTAMNLFKNVLSVGLLIATLPLLALGGQAVSFASSAQDWAALIVSGILGMAVADTLLFVALRRLGAARMAICECVYAPSIVALSVVFLDEPIGPALVWGGLLVVGGVTLATTQRQGPEPELPADSISLGWAVAAGVGAMLTMAAGVILTKPALSRWNLVEATLVRTAAGVAGQLVFIAVTRRRATAFAVFRDRQTLKTLIPASVLGTYVAMLFWLGGFKWADASVAAVLNQLSSVFTIALAWLILGEALTGRRVVGGAVAVAGAVLIMLIRPS